MELQLSPSFTIPISGNQFYIYLKKAAQTGIILGVLSIVHNVTLCHVYIGSMYVYPPNNKEFRILLAF